MHIIEALEIDIHCRVLLKRHRGAASQKRDSRDFANIITTWRRMRVQSIAILIPAWNDEHSPETRVDQMMDYQFHDL